MRAGGCTVQQSLTAEAAAVVKQAVNLARRRGHAQVTPLHVANTMLSVTTGLLRASCLQSHSHPLHCKALELCFNVALNRLPSSASSSPMLTSHYHHHHHYPPSLSNALIAAFKRAQANQRRGSMETQQQPLLAVKIELDQLIISILDDPSVSRVMREAGFSSTQVKNNVEQAVSLENSLPDTPNPSSTKTKEVSSLQTLIRARSEDVRTVIDSLLVRPRKRSIVVVGETSAAAEAVVRGVIDRQEMDEGLRDLKFITLPLYSFSIMSKEEVDQKVRELRCLLVKRRGIVLYLGDLKWVAEYRLSLGRSGYCPIEHVVMEIRSMLCGGGGIDERFWVMGIGTYHTVMKCRVGSPSLEAVWGLQFIDIPAGSLELSLKCDSDPQSPLNSKKNRDWPSWSLQESVVNQLSCCADCSLKFETEAHGLPNFLSSGNGSISSNLPSWLQQYKRECKNEVTKDHVWIQNLCKKWNSICHSSHKYPPFEMTLHFSSTSPSSSISSHNHHHSIFHLETDQNPMHDLWLNSNPIPNPNPNSNSASSSDTMEMGHCSNKFKELNAENLKTLCTALEREVPWQSDIIPNIASTVLRCRSGMVRNKERTQPKEDTWLFFLGGDQTGKETITREIARLVFGSRASLVSIGFTRFSPTRSGLTDEEQCNKRLRSENRHGYRFLEKFAEEISENPHRVFLIEDVEQMDSYTHMGIRNAIQRGRIQRLTGEEIDVCDAIVVFCCERFDSRSKVCSPRLKQRFEIEELNGEDGICLDLNLSVGDDCSLDDVGLTEFVDLAVLFKFPDL